MVVLKRTENGELSTHSDLSIDGNRKFAMHIFVCKP